MTESNQTRLLRSISILMGLFLVDENRFPSAEGRMKYNPLDFQTLRYLETYPKSRGAEIARALNVAPTTQQSVLDRLIKRGFVERLRHESNKRARVHQLTSEGQEVRDAIYRQDIENMKTVLSTLNPDEQEVMLRLLEKVVSGLE